MRGPMWTRPAGDLPYTKICLIYWPHSSNYEIEIHYDINIVTFLKQPEESRTRYTPRQTATWGNWTLMKSRKDSPVQYSQYKYPTHVCQPEWHIPLIWPEPCVSWGVQVSLVWVQLIQFHGEPRETIIQLVVLRHWTWNSHRERVTVKPVLRDDLLRETTCLGRLHILGWNPSVRFLCRFLKKFFGLIAPEHVWQLCGFSYNPGFLYKQLV